MNMTKWVQRQLRATFTTLAFAFSVLAGAASAQPAAQYYVHSAQSGDTLIGVAKRYLIKSNDWQSLQKLNKIANPNRIRPGTAIRIPLLEMNTDLAPAKVVAIEGPVESSSGKLAVGSAIGEGQDIKTSDNGFVTLKLADGSTFVVQSKSKVKLDAARTVANTNGIPVTRIALESGRVEAQVEKQKGAGAGRFEVRTPTSNMGVRGTKFRVSTDESANTSRGEVIEGIVNVAGSDPGRALDLNAGFGTIVAQNTPPIPPVKLPAAPDLSSIPKLQERPVLRFKFAEAPGVSGYRAQIATDSGFNQMRAEAVFKTAEAKFADLADGQYFCAYGQSMGGVSKALMRWCRFVSKHVRNRRSLQRRRINPSSPASRPNSPGRHPRRLRRTSFSLRAMPHLPHPSPRKSLTKMRSTRRRQSSFREITSGAWRAFAPMATPVRSGMCNRSP